MRAPPGYQDASECNQSINNQNALGQANARASDAEQDKSQRMNQEQAAVYASDRSKLLRAKDTEVVSTG